MEPTLEVRKLTKKYRKSLVNSVDGISFSLKEGEILGFLGPNGSGKTTTIQMLLGLLSPTSGEIFYFGKDFFTHRSESLHSVSFASTYTNLPSNLTVEENLHVFGKIYGYTKKETLQQAMPLLEQLGMDKLLHRTASGFSSGQMTRLMLVKALFINPKIVLLDEPTASLDPEASNELCKLLLERREKTGLSILFTSHKLQEVSDLCDRVIFLKKGKIVANETPSVLAKMSGSIRLHLQVPNGQERLIEYLNASSLPFTKHQHKVEILIEEHQIPPLLSTISKMEIHYDHIQIKEPSLDDYFLQMAKL